MSGHSKWSTIRRKKGVVDQKRGREFSKIIRALTLAARKGGGDVNSNSVLRTLVEKAKSVNMPADNITKAILRGTGDLEGVTYEEFTYEGYGPFGVAILVETVSDNRNRTTAEVRHILSKHGGQLGETGCVQWMFDKKGVILVEKDKAEEDKLMEIALENGAEEMQEDGEWFRITTAPADFDAVKKSLAAAAIPVENAEISMEAQTQVKLEGKQAEAIVRIVNLLEENDDVQNVYANFDIPDEVLEKMAGR